MTDDNGPRLGDIVVLLLLALLVRLIEWYDIDASDGWRVGAHEDSWRQAIDTDALARREAQE